MNIKKYNKLSPKFTFMIGLFVSIIVLSIMGLIVLFLIKFNILIIIKNFLSIINNYSNLGILIIAIYSFLYVRKEYFLKRRPYIDIDISPEIEDEKWGFFVKLINKGTFPGIARISKAILKVGDETHPTIFNNETILAPEEQRKLFYIGYINEIGLKKIRNHEYKNNRVEIIIACEAKAIGDKKFLYKTHYEYEINVNGKKPIIKIISESLN